MQRIIRAKIALLAIVFLLTSSAFAGPPFLTDDPEPVEFHHYEFYTFYTLDRLNSEISPGVRGSTYSIFFPAFEFNIGAAPNLQLHMIVPGAFSVSNPGSTNFGMGDMELGVKYRCLQEKKWRPQAGTFPMAEVSTGDSSRGLGNGTTWYRLPIWLQKSWGPWTSYGGAGYVINHARGMQDHVFAGWQVQRQLNKKWTLGVEWFDPGHDTAGGEGTQLVNAGGFYNFRDNFSLLFTGGHSFHGESHTIAYVGLYWTWGPKSEEPAKPGEKSGDAAWLSQPVRACAPLCR